MKRRDKQGWQSKTIDGRRKIAREGGIREQAEEDTRAQSPNLTGTHRGRVKVKYTEIEKEKVQRQKVDGKIKVKDSWLEISQTNPSIYK